MAQTRSKSSLASIHERITAFNNKFRNPEALKQLGWEDVPIVDVFFFVDPQNVLLRGSKLQM